MIGHCHDGLAVIQCDRFSPPPFATPMATGMIATRRQKPRQDRTTNKADPRVFAPGDQERLLNYLPRIVHSW